MLLNSSSINSSSLNGIEMDGVRSVTVGGQSQSSFAAADRQMASASVSYQTGSTNAEVQTPVFELAVSESYQSGSTEAVFMRQITAFSESLQAQSVATSAILLSNSRSKFRGAVMSTANSTVVGYLTTRTAVPARGNRASVSAQNNMAKV